MQFNSQQSETSTPETPQPVYYQPPESHDAHVKKMLLWLAGFFTTFFILLGIVIVFADKLVVYLPFSAEKQFVRPYEEIGTRFFSSEPSEESETIESYLQKLGDSLSQSIELPSDYQITIHFLDSDEINAFATLGGHIFICRGLLESMPDENSLAMVLAHEIAHIKHRDPAVGMTRGLALQMIYSFATGDYGNSELAGYGSELGLLYFSREQEQAADFAAINTLNHAYGHVSGFDRIFQQIKQEQGENEIESENEEREFSPNWLSSHPDLDARINYLTEQKDQHGWLLGTVSPIPEVVSSALESALEPGGEN